MSRETSSASLHFLHSSNVRSGVDTSAGDRFLRYMPCLSCALQQVTTMDQPLSDSAPHGGAFIPGGIPGEVPGAHAPHVGFWALTIGSIGVVYGDIGTSPLYAMHESLLAATSGGGAATQTVVLGICSLIIWALLLVVTAKYVIILLRADNKGEGGTLALMALASHSFIRRGGTIILLGIVSGALFYGDAIDRKSVV